MEMNNNGIAVLSSFDKYTTFSFGDKKLTFRTCNGLEKYTKGMCQLMCQKVYFWCINGSKWTKTRQGLFSLIKV